MCLLFFYYNPNAKSNEYKLILINTRDEYYFRPTLKASFWENRDNSVIGGRDNEPGRQGGTWLALNRNGQFACLLNILQPRKDIRDDKKGRGSLVSDFVCDATSNPKSYLDKIAAEGSDYNGFLLLTMNVARGQIAYFTNMDEDEPRVIEAGFHSFGNSPPKNLWDKVIIGGDRFKKIVTPKQECSQRDQLLHELQEMLKDKTIYPLTKQILDQGEGLPKKYVEKLHSIFVENRDVNYGTRSHTIILVSGNGNVEFIEESMVTPVDFEKGVNWDTVIEKFDLL